MPPIATTPYPTAEQCLNRARAALADAGMNGNAIVGDALTDDRAGVWELLNGAYGWLRRELANSGVQTFAKEQTLLNIPPVATLDPGVYVYMNFNVYNDGVSNHSPAFDGVPVLPSDLIIPLWMQQRRSGTLDRFIPDPPMGASHDGLPSRIKTTYSLEWEWRQDSIFTVGGLVALDWKIRYVPTLPSLAFTGNSQTDGAQQLSIIDSVDAIGLKLAAKFAKSVGSPKTEELDGDANEAKDQLIYPSVRQQQRGNFRRQGYSRRGRGWGNSY